MVLLLLAEILLLFEQTILVLIRVGALLLHATHELLEAVDQQLLVQGLLREMLILLARLEGLIQDGQDLFSLLRGHFGLVQIVSSRSLPEHHAHDAFEQKLDDQALVHEVRHLALTLLELDRNILVHVKVVQFL